MDKPDNGGRNINRRAFVLGSAALPLSSIPEVHFLFGQSDTLHASEVLKDESYVSGMNRLWSDTERTGLEHSAIFVKYKDGKTAWVRMKASIRTLNAIAGTPLWEGASKENILFAIHIHTHPSDPPGREKVSHPPSENDISLTPDIHRSRTHLKEGDASHIYGAVRVKSGAYYFSRNTEAELRQIFPKEGLDLDYVRASSTVARFRSDIAAPIEERVNKAPIATILTLVPDAMGDPRANDYQRNISRLQRALKASQEGRLVDKWDEFNLRLTVSSWFAVPYITDVAKLDKAILLLEGRVTPFVENYKQGLRVIREENEALTRVFSSFNKVRDNFYLASSKVDGDEVRLLREHPTVFRDLQVGYAGLGTYVTFVPNTELERDIGFTTNPVSRR